MAEVTTYTARVRRDGRFWLIHVPEVDRSTQARHLREVEDMARDLIALMDDIPEDSFDLDVQTELPEDIAQELGIAVKLRERAARDQHDAAAHVRAAAAKLHDQGLTYRDIGQALGVSHQRAKQLVDGARTPEAPGGRKLTEPHKVTEERKLEKAS